MEILDKDTRGVLQVVDYAERTGEPLSPRSSTDSPRTRVGWSAQFPQ